MTLEKLRQAHGSVPGNPLLAEPMYLTGYIERMGTGTRDMIRRCTEAGLPEPEFAGSVRVPDDHPADSGPQSGSTARVSGDESPPASRGRAEVQSGTLAGARTERDLRSAQQGRPQTPGRSDDRVHHP
ncbi:MAG: hypothetical protein M0P17_01325 [Methanoculleus sp.]|nr:hypothetical protein [Methanoculleus sp.]